MGKSLFITLIFIGLTKECYCAQHLTTEEQYEVLSDQLGYCRFATTSKEFKDHYALLQKELEEAPVSLWGMKNPNKGVDKRSILDKIVRYTYGSYNVIDGSLSWGPCYQRDYTQYYLDLLTQYSKKVTALSQEKNQGLNNEETLTLLNPLYILGVCFKKNKINFAELIFNEINRCIDNLNTIFEPSINPKEEHYLALAEWRDKAGLNNFQQSKKQSFFHKKVRKKRVFIAFFQTITTS